MHAPSANIQSHENLGGELTNHSEIFPQSTAGIIPGLRSANGRRRYKETPSLIGCAQT